MKLKEYHFKTEEIEATLSEFEAKGITELSVYDDSFADNKQKILQFLKAVEKKAPFLFVALKINPKIIDFDVLNQAMKINCSLELPFAAYQKQNGPYLFDKKFYSKKCNLLNNNGFVFGASLTYADISVDTFKFFKDRIDFTVEQYPNHIDFPQIENSELAQTAKVSGIFSAEEIRFARNIAFACKTFYSAGRAVPWFLSILHALKIQPSKFFADFAEWQKVNNCDYTSGFVPEDCSHKEIEKMQLLFLAMKFEEKNKTELIPIVNDIVKLNGAFSRLVGEGEESVIFTKYNPDDLLSPEAMDLNSFNNNVCMENCNVKIYLTDEGPDYKII